MKFEMIHETITDKSHPLLKHNVLWQPFDSFIEI